MTMTARPRNIAFCENGAGYGGAIMSLEAMLELLPAPFTPHIYTGIGAQPYPQLARFGTWRHLPPIALLSQAWLRSHKIPFASSVDNLFNMLPTALRYYFAFKRDRIDLVYLNNDASCNMPAAMAAWMAGLPAILHARGFNTDTRGNRWVFDRLKHCMPVSNAVRQELVALGFSSEKCTVVAEGLDLKIFHPHPADPALRASLDLGDMGPVITLVGGLVDWKGQDVLLDAAPRILARYPQALMLLIGAAYGRDPSFAETIGKRAADRALGGGVRLLGARSDVAAILALSDIVLHTSTTPEPFGRTFLEGMALGKAVIASNEGGPLDVIDHGVDGLLITPRDPQLLADAILLLLDNPDLRTTLGANAAIKARDYSIERHTATVCAVLRAQFAD